MIAVLSLLITAQSVKPIELMVDGVARTGAMVVPASIPEEGVPLVFAWHGHGGGARQAQRSFGIEKAWPEAAVIYLQGLNTPGRLSDPEGKKPGWQGNAGEMEDRDLKLFDAVLAWAKKEIKVDKVFTMGHSNGGGFSYLLWMSRPNTFAAIGVSAGGFRTVDGIKPAPLIHIGGRKILWFAIRAKAERWAGCGRSTSVRILLRRGGMLRERSDGKAKLVRQLSL
ncbi:hypothetical protein CCB80_09445 [Armatimonadetes bacterium Uphvl-Ar1]|nr:hypothetical protein CCB80_09445 [Armatimonadetes bacterium Uphvl-Ar1]